MRKIIATAAVVAMMAVPVTAGAATVTAKPTAAQRAQLQYLVEEEKLARNVYTYLATTVTSQKFSNIARSEQTHMDNIAALLKKYGIFNPTLTRDAGVFRNSQLQSLYNELIAKGSAGITQAFAVGVEIEKLDISDLQKMMQSSAPADMASALVLLLKGSQNHLAAFTR
jgi:hypothetical protein